MGEAMLKGKIADVQKLVFEYKTIEEQRRDAETETLGVGDEIDFDAEIEMAQKKEFRAGRTCRRHDQRSQRNDQR